MSNTEWKKGYEEGFSAGWKASKEQHDKNYTNFPPVYYGAGTYSIKPTHTVGGGFTATMTDTTSS